MGDINIRDHCKVKIKEYDILKKMSTQITEIILMHVRLPACVFPPSQASHRCQLTLLHKTFSLTKKQDATNESTQVEDTPQTPLLKHFRDVTI